MRGHRGRYDLVPWVTRASGPGHAVLGFYDMQGAVKSYKNPLLSGFHSSGVGYADEVAVGNIRYVSDAPVVGASLGAMINANHFAACVGLTLPVTLGLLVSAQWSV